MAIQNKPSNFTSKSSNLKRTSLKNLDSSYYKPEYAPTKYSAYPSISNFDAKKANPTNYYNAGGNYAPGSFVEYTMDFSLDFTS